MDRREFCTLAAALTTARTLSKAAGTRLILLGTLSHHTTAEEAGRIAKAAGVKTLVLSHRVPAEDPLISDQMWLDAARSQFAGQIIVGRDLLEL